MDKLTRVAPEIVFAVRMLMLRYQLTPADMLKILVSLEKGE